ncbi:Rieske (2Fe-2S) protein [Rhodococcus pseudokoreensis]|uniref:Rieske (2Fe-2S) protein n=1 Tax=Rhodococcus pseudokoreensis TaxID=2811421 RepID=A0A974ZX69_9NOCA|nr:Rieske (2Fe-2S) protein [Rhodococcus pseudokoreensis]QSE93759.1 Rieske (2Fe-2S) protein [Rhodococcus pseudokoreensis]
MAISARPVAPDIVVARSTDVLEGRRHLVAVDDVHLGLFRFRGKLYAYENACPHMGGPVCQDRMVDGVLERIEDDRTSRGMTFDEDDPHVVCPWHGFEFRITTGEHAGFSKIRLRSFPVTEDGGEIRVRL